MFESKICEGTGKLSASKATVNLDAETVSSWSYDTEGHAKKRVERCCELAIEAAEQLHKVATPYVDDHHSKKKMNLENWHSFAHKMFSSNTWHALEDMIFYGQWINLHVLLAIGPELVTSVWHVWSLLHSSHMRIQAILICGKHSTTMQTWIMQRVISRRFRRLKINVKWNPVHFRKWHVSANRLDWMCKKTDFNLTQFYRSWNDFSACKFTHGWDSRSRSLGFSDWNISSSPHETNKNQRCKKSHSETCRLTHKQTCKTQIPTMHTDLDLINIDHVPSRGTHSGSNNMFLR